MKWPGRGIGGLGLDQHGLGVGPELRGRDLALRRFLSSSSTEATGCCPTRIWSVTVVITSLEDLYLFVVGPVYEAVFVVDTAGPVAGQIAF